VKVLGQLFTQLMDEHKKAKQEEENKEVLKVTQKISELVWKDVDDLQLNFPHLLTDELINEVEDELSQSGLDENAKPKREELDTAFNKTFWELQYYLTMDADSRDTDASLMVAYKLLCIGEQMKAAFNGDEEERAHLALQQFAANLAVYALHLDNRGGNANEGCNDDKEDIYEVQIIPKVANWHDGLDSAISAPAWEGARKSVFVDVNNQQFD
jgi:hypothetical protein